MQLLIYNTLSGKREFFEPYKRGEVTVYVCGPTLSDYVHLGHARTYLSFDTIIRHLEYNGYKVEYVVNLTDLDDTIIGRAKEEDKDPLAFSRRFEQAFLEDMKPFRLRSADNYPRASDHVQEIIDMIQKLVLKGLAYESNGVVYFDASKYRNFGRLFRHGRNAYLFRRLFSVSFSCLCSLLHSICPVAVRALRNSSLVSRLPAFLRYSVDIDSPRRDPCDFYLWKRVSKDDPGWESPWGRGRPCWHAECSVMSRKYLGQQLDIHGGGSDLKSDTCRHHPSEIALSESCTSKEPFVRYWMHVGLLTLNGRKMSKSTGNFITVRDYLEKHDAESFRLLILSKRYRQRLDFSERELAQHEVMIKKIYKIRDALSEVIKNPSDREPNLKEETEILSEIAGLKMEFLAAMNDDFNTAIALAHFYELIELGNKILNVKTSKNLAEIALNTINELSDILGLLQERKHPPVSTQVPSPKSSSVRIEPIPISTCTYQ